MLQVTDLHSYYGNIHALKGISLNVEQGEIVTLIGANGAGKTTTLRAICGLVAAREGAIELEGENLGKYKAHQIVFKGVSMVPEGRGIFARLTVAENLDLGAYSLVDRKDQENDLKTVFNVFPRLKERAQQVAGTLSGGEQQMLAIGRALMAHPRLLLLDEPSMGLAPILVESIFNTIREINRQGTTILLVEQNAQLALAIADRAYVLETGKIVMQGKGQELLKDERVIEAYLGGH
ncbi:MAG TPA: ABC transporter ATP-binding protein [Anaerolineales bacterium]|jgi:branched-chain amino acid transport system ATP-binding protein